MKRRTPPPQGEERKEPAFEEAIGRIEEIVARLEGGDLTLDESLALFQEGVELSRRCQVVLDEAQRKIEMLVRAADGTLRTESLDEPDAGGSGAGGGRSGGASPAAGRKPSP